MEQEGVMTITGKAETVKPKEGAIEDLKGDISVDELTPKAIHSYITKAYADLFGFEVSSTLSESEIVLVLK